MSTLLYVNGRASKSALSKVEDQCADALERMPMGPGLHDGLSGVALAIECAYQTGRRFSEHREALRPLYTQLAQLAGTSRLGNCDLISGAAGIGVALSAVHPQPADLLAGLVENILGTVNFDRNPPLWAIDESGRRGLAGQDLGIAHGIPGLMLVLVRLRCLVAPKVAERIDAFLRQSARWLANCVNAPGSGSMFPYTSGQETSSRLAWCYGDLSVAYALLASGVCADDDLAVSLGRTAVNRAITRPIEEVGVNNAFLCHGSSGLLALMQSINLADVGVIPVSYMERWAAVLAKQARTSLTAGSLSGFDLLDGWTGVGLFLDQGRGRIPSGWRSAMLLPG